MQITDEMVEEAAKAIFEHWQFQPAAGTLIPWVPKGNSLKQDEARDYARAALSAALGVAEQDMVMVSRDEWRKVRFRAGIDDPEEIAALTKIAGKPEAVTHAAQRTPRPLSMKDIENLSPDEKARRLNAAIADMNYRRASREEGK